MRFSLAILAMFGLLVSVSACPAGWYLAGSTRTCTFCPANTYSSSADSTSCTPCPAGQVSGIGSTSCSTPPNTQLAMPTQVAIQCGGSISVLSNGYCLPSGSNMLYSNVGILYPSDSSWNVYTSSALYGGGYDVETYAYVQPLSSCTLGDYDLCDTTIPSDIQPPMVAIGFPLDSTSTPCANGNGYLSIGNANGIGSAVVGDAVVATCVPLGLSNTEAFYLLPISLPSSASFALQSISTPSGANHSLCVQVGSPVNGVVSLSLQTCNTANSAQQFYFYGDLIPYPLQTVSTFVGSSNGVLYSFGLSAIVSPNALGTYLNHRNAATYTVLDQNDGLHSTTAEIQVTEVTCTAGTTYCTAGGSVSAIQFPHAPSTCTSGQTYLAVSGGSAAVKAGASVVAICDTGVATTAAWNIELSNTYTTHLSNLYTIQPFNNPQLCLEVQGQSYLSVTFTLAECNVINPRQYWGFATANL